MANPKRGETAFSVGGQERKLLLDINALCELEDHLGLTLDVSTLR